MSKIEVDAIDKQSGSTLTLGGSGTAVTLACGATQTGFGRTGTVNWQTSIKTATFTATSGEGYFCNTSGGAFTVNLPSSPSVGDIVAIKDYGSSFATQNLTIGRGGSNLNGDATDTTRNTDNESLTMVYADATKGWLSVEEGTGFLGESFVSACGGTVTTSPCGNDKIHTFTGPGTFTVNSIASCAANNILSYLVVAGGGGAGHSYPTSNAGGGGGAGGYREVKNPATPYTASPLDGYPTPGNRITASPGSYPIQIGGGGTGASPSAASTSGAQSVFSTITSTGGGNGAHSGPGGGGSPQNAGTGGSGGGGGGGTSSPGSWGNGAAGNTPATTPAQGKNGGSNQVIGSGSGTDNPGGAGGGATACGQDGQLPSNGGNGGAGGTTSINGSPTAFAGGGAGGGNPSGAGGTGGGGGGGVAGTVNTGGGGGGTMNAANGGAGGSGIIIIRYKFQ